MKNTILIIKVLTMISMMVTVLACKSTKNLSEVQEISESAIMVSDDSQTSNNIEEIQTEELANRITHGPMLGRPSSTTMAIWARTFRPGTIEVEFSKLDEGATPRYAEAITTIIKDNTGVVDLTDLEPNTKYSYLIRVKGNPGGKSGTFKTWIDESITQNPEHNPEGLYNFRFEFACGNSQSLNGTEGDSVLQKTFETINKDHAHELDFAILNGDWLYERSRNFSLDEWKEQTGTNETPAFLEPIPRIVGIWENYKSYLERGRDMARLHTKVPYFFTMDDHEVLNDLAGSGQTGFRERRAVLRDLGVQAWNDYLAWSNPTEFDHEIHFSRASFVKGSDILTDMSVDFTKMPIDEMSNLHVHWGGDRFSTRLRKKDEYPGLPNAKVYAIEEVIDEHRLRISPPAAATSEADAYSIGRRSYGQFEVSNCHFFLIDTRSHRDVPDFNKPDRSDKSILGAEQLRWLKEGIAASEAEFILWFRLSIL